ncbi:hypothetical protein G3N55_09990 [Dissulfurirhabdus thermomarina]|uniref:Uncharacterized protein n=1 Tax=Dissulfurirhabdus thermomarina TaxID=1765737 RepID=A0A6N9TPT0_DISTH|nr:hypothetical protein [Dissulfurirhabdus thermomarina]NDY43169.1 hypothetical protein [Dissulfurirhabdus thermomarina]NMX22435.1 hypothetical protein [Dissulfurirhabdus thermomarina]
MEIPTPNLHLKLQEMCDCYMDTDYVGQMRAMAGAEPGDLTEAALKYLALAILAAVTERARKLSIKNDGGLVTVEMKDEAGKTVLPAPPAAVAAEAIRILRAVTDIREDRGESPLSLGLRSGSLDLSLKVKRKDGKESAKLRFPAA